MIAKLKGLVDSVDTDSAVIDVGGVGYLVSASARTLRDLSVGGPATMLVETIVREDAIALYGFLQAKERDWFRILTTVQGVGARVRQHCDRAWGAGERRAGHVVVIGQTGMDRAGIEAAILAAETA